MLEKLKKVSLLQWGLLLIAASVLSGAIFPANNRSEKVGQSLARLIFGVSGICAVAAHVARSRKQRPSPQPEQPPTSLQPLDRSEFAAEIGVRIKARYPDLNLIFDAEEFHFLAEKTGKGDEYSVQINLTNHYQRYLGSHPENRESCLEWIADRAYFDRPTSPKTFEEAAPYLMPSLRDRYYPDSIRMRFEIEDNGSFQLPHKLIGDRLTVCLVIDSEKHLTLVNEDQLAEWGVSLEEALERAMENLSNLPLKLVEMEEGIYVAHGEDDYEASRLVLLGGLGSEILLGKLVVMAPNRSTLLVADSENENGLLKMVELAESALASPGGINGFATLWNGQWWEEWMPVPKSAAYQGFRNLAVRSLGEQYQEQKEFFESLQKQKGEDIFVATFMAYDTPDGLLSLCTWANGVDSLLPKTHAIAFVDGDGEKGEFRGLIPWAMVEARVGHLLEDTGVYPKRYRVRSFPDPESLSDLGQFNLNYLD